jgi:hypothetical protein
MSLFTWAKTGQAQPGSRGAPAPWSRWHWLADSGGDLWQGGPGRAARATRRGGEPAGGISGRRVHRSGLSVVGGGTGSRERTSASRSGGQRAAHGRGGARGQLSWDREQVEQADTGGLLRSGPSGWLLASDDTQRSVTFGQGLHPSSRRGEGAQGRSSGGLLNGDKRH